MAFTAIGMVSSPRGGRAASRGRFCSSWSDGRVTPGSGSLLAFTVGGIHCWRGLLLRGDGRVTPGSAWAQAFELGYRLGGQSAATTRSGVLEVYGRGLRRLFTPRELCGIDLKGFEFWRWVLGRPWALGREARATFWALGGLWALGAIGRRRRGLRARYFERCLLRSF